MWMQAVTAYKVAYGQEPGSKGDVLAYLRDYPIRLRVGQYNVPKEGGPEPTGEPGNTIYAISAVRE